MYSSFERTHFIKYLALYINKIKIKINAGA